MIHNSLSIICTYSLNILPSDAGKPHWPNPTGRYLVHPVNNDKIAPTVVTSNDLRSFMQSHGFCDITSLIPTWISCHGWIHGLNTISVTEPDRTDLSWIRTVYFDDQLLCPPRKKLPRTVVEGFLVNQLKQRTLVLRLLGIFISDTFQQLQVLGSGPNTSTPFYDNDYDLTTGYDMYERLWNAYRLKWDQQTRVVASPARPIHDQLAYPPKALRWHTFLDKPTNIPRNKWDRRLILNDFHATLSPHTFLELDNMDVFDLPLPNEPGEEDSILLAEIDQLLDYFFIPLQSKAAHSTLLDQDLVQEELDQKIPHLLCNLDLQKEEIDAIVRRFSDTGIKIKDMIDLIFDIKQHDHDLLLNRILLFANSHIDQLKKLDSQSKQILNNFIIDFVSFFGHLRTRQNTTTVDAPWLQQGQPIHQLEAIMTNRIHMDLKALQPLITANCIDINRFQTSILVHQMVRAYDLYTVSTSYLVNQFSKNAQIFTKLLTSIANHKDVNNLAVPGILKYILVRHPGRGSLTQLQPQQPILRSGLSGLAASRSTSVFSAGAPPSTSSRKRITREDDGLPTKPVLSEDDDMKANSREATFDLLDDTME